MRAKAFTARQEREKNEKNEQTERTTEVHGMPPLGSVCWMEYSENRTSHFYLLLYQIESIMSIALLWPHIDPRPMFKKEKKGYHLRVKDESCSEKWHSSYLRDEKYNQE